MFTSKRLLLSTVLAALLAGLVLVSPAAARSTGGAVEDAGGGLRIQISDASGGRHINYSWTNFTGATQCVTAYWWYKGVPNGIDTRFRVGPGATLPFHAAGVYSVFADATIEIYDCNTGGSRWHYLIGALTNPNRWF